ncbi:MAG: crossover junction endodeoxyribonuclease RuvC [Clostridiales bacterium]|nr:crossover junction endodeoxyribonuclease RuvC [Clostridiales bacterium]
MIVLGIDPGMAIIGYGVVEKKNNILRPIDYGAITTPPTMEIPQRLVTIYDAVQELIARFQPDEVAIEELFFNKNVKTAITVGHARGVSVLAAAKTGLNLYEYTPLQVKQSVVGYGRAEKSQIQQMVKALLGLKEIPKPDDAADALAVAICHIHCADMGRKYGSRSLFC